MELEVGALTGVAYGEKNLERIVQRNGYWERDWQTRLEPSSCASPSFIVFPYVDNNESNPPLRNHRNLSHGC